MPADGTPLDPIGLVVALPAEARSIGVRGVGVGGCARWRHGWVAVSGMGPHNAMRAAERLLACGVRGIANWGVAGALDASLSPGDILLPEYVRFADDDPGFPTDALMRAQLAMAMQGELAVHGGGLWSATRPLASPEGKRRLAASAGVRAVDMEAAPIAAVAARARLPFIAVKAICDPLAREVPASIVRALDATNAGPSLRMVAAIVVGGPATWRAAHELSRDFRRARRALATAAALAA